MIVRFFRHFILTVVWLLSAGLAIAAQVTVSFRSTAEITEPRIVLADIAVIKPAGDQADQIGQLVVAVAPPPGKSKELQTASVITSLRNRPEVAGVDWQGSPTIMVQRKTHTLSQQQFIDIITAYIDENSGLLPKGEIRFIPIHTPQEVSVPPGRLSWKVTPSKPGILGSNSFTIALLVDGKQAGTHVVRGKLEVMAEVVTAATMLQKGDILSETNVILQSQDIGSLDKPFMATGEVIGKQVARTVSAGTVLKPDHLVLPPVIKEGEMVKILARKETMQLSASGLAKTDGRLGESIAVKNISSNKMIHARVAGPGIVTVEF